MTAYIIADIQINDAEKFKEYSDRVPEFIRKYQARFIVRGGDPVNREGDWAPQRVVVVEFPSKSLAEAFLDDPQYQEIADIRRASTSGKLIIVEGC